MNRRKKINPVGLVSSDIRGDGNLFAIKKIGATKPCYFHLM